jgi:dolichyl-phosphate beta-glucosyltransferase
VPIDLSVVIPALDEQAKIGTDVRAVAEFLTRVGLSGETIIVDDGSTDGTADAARSAAREIGADVTVLSLDRHRGKGCAVRTGMLRSRGRCAMFADSGQCVPMASALRGMDMIRRGGCEIAHGSRYLPESRRPAQRSAYRRAVGAVFRAAAPALAGVPEHLTDTQCGFKLYRGDVARELYGECGTDGFLFDLEVILRALARGYRIAEFPVEWHADPDSRLRPLRALPGLARDFLRLPRN